MLLNIQLDFNIWIYADISVQKELINQLTNYTRKNPKMMRALFSVQTILDILRDYYFINTDVDSIGAAPRYHPVTTQVLINTY